MLDLEPEEVGSLMFAKILQSIEHEDAIESLPAQDVRECIRVGNVGELEDRWDERHL